MSTQKKYVSMSKIVIIVSDITQTGGTERAAISLSNLLCNDFEVVILSLHLKNENQKPFYQLDDKIGLVNLGLDIKGSAVNLINNYKAVGDYLKSNPFNFVFGLWHGISILLPFIRVKNCKYIACEHADFVANTFLVRKLMMFSYPKLNGLVVLSNLAKEKMFNLNKAVSVIPNSLPFEINSSATLQEKRILMVGRLVEVKGYERVFPLAKYLLDNFPDWTIDIFGDGHLKVFLQKQLDELKLSNIKIHASVKDIKKEYLNSSVFLSTSYNEALPMVFIEAMSCGLPVISYKNEGAVSLLNNCGVIVNSEFELIDRCSDLLNDFNLRYELGLKGRKEALNYTPARIKEKWIKYLHSL